jgi:hypothetical protein
MLDLMGVVAMERQRQLREEADRYRLAAMVRRERGRHRKPFTVSTFGRGAVSNARVAGRRVLAALRTAARDIAETNASDPALPHLRDYPIAPPRGDLASSSSRTPAA